LRRLNRSRRREIPACSVPFVLATAIAPATFFPLD
jgi:hypothetical protein